MMKKQQIFFYSRSFIWSNPVNLYQGMHIVSHPYDRISNNQQAEIPQRTTPRLNKRLDKKLKAKRGPVSAAQA